MRRPRLCAYCGSEENLTRDHVVPRCLFEKPFPLNLITVTACEACNQAKAQNDDFLRDLLIADIHGSQSPVAQRLFHGPVLSSVRRNSSQIARIAVRDGSWGPYFSHGGIYLGEAFSFSVDEHRLKKILTDIVRGLFFDSRRQILPSHYSFEVRRVKPSDWQDSTNMFLEKGVNGPRILGNVFGCMYLSAQEDPPTTLWLLWFYERVVFSVSAMNPDLVEERLANAKNDEENL